MQQSDRCLPSIRHNTVQLHAGIPALQVQLGVMGLCFDTHSLLFMLAQGFSSAASTRVSNELGRTGPQHSHVGQLHQGLELTKSNNKIN
jgi:hypothetical protein